MIVREYFMVPELWSRPEVLRAWEGEEVCWGHNDVEAYTPPGNVFSRAGFRKIQEVVS
jgi:hypothetical protein